MKAARGKILVIRGGAIGDFILTLPAIAALRRQFPDAYLEVLGYPHIIQLAIAGNLVDKASSIEAQALAGFFARGGDLSESLAEYFSEFDLILSYLYDPDLIFRTNVARCTRAQFIAGPHRPTPGEQLHASKLYLQPLERLAIFDADSVPRLTINTSRTPPRGFPSPTACASAPVLALHPGSGGERKNWPEAAWAELLQALVTQTPFKFVLAGGEAEGERLQRLAATMPPTRTRVAQSLPLAELAALLSGCNGFVGHDSGISHLAAALGLPVLVLWGPTQETIWRPPGEKVSLLRHPAGLPDLTVEEVLNRIKILWPVFGQEPA